MSYWKVTSVSLSDSEGYGHTDRLWCFPRGTLIGPYIRDSEVETLQIGEQGPVGGGILRG